jgi:hypothetical protein
MLEDVPLSFTCRQSCVNETVDLCDSKFRLESLITRDFFIQIAQPQDGRHRMKGKLTNPEFNKILQANLGFVCARTRKKPLAR